MAGREMDVSETSNEVYQPNSSRSGWKRKVCRPSRKDAEASWKRVRAKCGIEIALRGPEQNGAAQD